MTANADATECERLVAIFERITGAATVTERQYQGVSHRVYEDEQ
jgi:hypothetical protein